MKFKKTGCDLRPREFGVTAPPTAQVVLTLLFLGMVGAVLHFARPGAVDGVMIAAMAALSFGSVLFMSFVIWRWYRTPRYCLKIANGCIDEGSVVSVAFEQIGQVAVGGLSVSVICYNPAAIGRTTKGVPPDYLKREYCDKFSSAPLRSFAESPAPTHGLLELRVPLVKEKKLAWGIRVDYVVRGDHRQEFFVPRD